VEMVTGWTGRDACALQSALRMSNQAFAEHLGIGLRTVADWHEKPGMRPRPAMQQFLDTALAQAPAAARERFAALTGHSARAESTGPGVDGAATDAVHSPDPGHRPASRSVAVEVNYGIISTGAGATIDARTIRLPSEAVRAPATVAAARGLHNLPAPSSPVFVDREEDLAQLDVVMSQEPPVSPPVVHGLGGTGKSALALHFAHRNRDRYNPIWWISADSPASVTTALAELAARLNPYQSLTAQTSAEGATWAVGWLQAHDGWLLVLDDADSPRSIESLLGTLTAGRHLITSRRATGWHRAARLLPLATLAPDDALEMLLRITSPGDDADRAPFGHLAAELGYLPLALEQAAAYIQYTAISPAAYLDRLRRYPARMFAAPASPETAGESGRQRTIARLWQLSVQAISAEQPLAGEILRVIAWLSPDPIPRDLAYHLHDDPLTVDDALALLHAYSMITLNAQSITIHRLVQAVARTPDPADPHRTPEAISQARDRAVQLLLAALPPDPLFNVPGWPRWRELLPHVLALTGHIGPDQDTAATAILLLAASAFLQGDGHYGQAITSARRAVGACQRMRGADAPETLMARSFLASAYRAAGDLAAAAPLHQQNLSDCERVLGVDHPETLVARANLGYLYALQGQPARALELHERNVTDYERVHGPDHPHTLNARANLASSYRALGDLASAIELHQQSVTDYARVFGAGHSETTTARSNLAYACQLAGDFSRAIPLHQQVLADRERLYGRGHPYTELARQLLARAQQQASASEPAGNPDPDGRDAGN
jgi:tetratricopeptide (TPR) repeat protein